MILTKENFVVNTPNGARAKNGLMFAPKSTKHGLLITINSPKETDIPFLKAISNMLGGILVGDEGEKY